MKKNLKHLDIAGESDMEKGRQVVVPVWSLPRHPQKHIDLNHKGCGSAGRQALWSIPPSPPPSTHAKRESQVHFFSQHVTFFDVCSLRTSSVWAWWMCMYTTKEGGKMQRNRLSLLGTSLTTSHLKAHSKHPENTETERSFGGDSWRAAEIP